MSKLILQIVTPEREVLSREVDEVVLPSQNGSMGVLSGHAPLLALLDTGAVEYRDGGERKLAAVCGGFAEIQRTGVKILANTCEMAEEIDLERARRSQERGQNELGSDAKKGEMRLASFRMQKALNRISIHQRLQGMMRR